jgi:hypothetical protein
MEVQMTQTAPGTYAQESKNNDEKVIAGLQAVELSLPGITTLITRLLQYQLNPLVVVMLVDILHNLSFDITNSPIRYRQIKINLRKNNDVLVVDNVEATTSLALEKKVYEANT